MAEYNRNAGNRKWGIVLLASVLVAILFGGAIVLTTNAVSDVDQAQASLDTSEQTEPDGTAAADEVAGASEIAGASESAPSDGNVIEGGNGQGVSDDESTIVDATTTVSYDCPDGSQGSASATESNCVTTADEETAAEELVTYRCPSGSSGEPTSADPTCERIDESAAVVIDTSYACPAGSGGDPNAADPTCAVTGQTKVQAVLDEDATEYGCPQGATQHSVGTQITCKRTVPGQESVPAQTRERYSCPRPLVGTASAQNPFCTQTSYPEADAEIVITYECLPGFSQSVSAENLCERKVQADIDAVYSCPQGSSPAGGPPSAQNPNCALDDGGRIPTLVPADVDAVYSCPPGTTGSPSAANSSCLEQVTARAVKVLTCPDGYVDHPSSNDPPCISTTPDETTVDAEVEVQYRCPANTTGTPTTENPNCTKQVPVEETVEPIVVRRVLACPPGSAGNPTRAQPFCAETTTEIVPAIVTETYGCSAGYGASGAVAAGGYCSRPLSVPAEIVTVEYRCPAGSTGTPTATDPTCVWTSSEPVDPVETTAYSCPPGTSGQPSAADPFCEGATTG